MGREFCRISRDGRLTLVIEDVFGAPCITYSAQSAFDNLDAAIENLRQREHMPSDKGVGFTVPSTGTHSIAAAKRHPEALRAVGAWTSASGFDAAIWTALACNFAEKTGEPFSVQAAVRYQNQNADSLSTSLTYIRKAPLTIKTALRDAINVLATVMRCRRAAMCSHAFW
jgi:hypothetical protein